ncbi:Sodium-coupled neutral amino acid transporter 2 [Sarcoptes scabiei]|uniref:Amino acid transporter ANTL2 n=1 Tax=Sarcoptes scabiei TaxID=52283 RepID=A0A834R2L3_SARSC|nr:Sodium-coupled neutral amino acid transporter 2 [Sarcoptes scabiei]
MGSFASCNRNGFPSIEQFTNEKRRGYSIQTATIFIIGEVAGTGILCLPYAVAQSNWIGLPLILYCAFCAGLCGYYLSKCWMILEDLFPEYRNRLTRKPFATIGFHAYGSWMSALVSIMLNLTRLGATTVFIILTSQLIISLTETHIGLDQCQWSPIVASVMLFSMWLGSPIDFWPLAYLAMLSTTIGSICLLASLIKLLLQAPYDLQVHENHHHHHSSMYEREQYLNQSTSDYLAKIEEQSSLSIIGIIHLARSFGTILYTFGGASAFPNFQNDMKNKKDFSKAVFFGFIGLILIYLPTAGLGYRTFGSGTKFNILMNFDTVNDPQVRILTTIVRICFLVHCLSVVQIVINPVFLDLEEILHIPKKFTWKRCLFRTLIMITLTLIAEIFPNFGQIVDLIGGSTISLMAFVLPPLFYLKLLNQSRTKILKVDDDRFIRQRPCPLRMKILFLIIITSGLVGGFISTLSTLSQWSPLESACFFKRFESSDSYQ